MSGASVWPLLALLAGGAAGADLVELESALGVPGSQAMDAASAALEGMDRAAGVCAALGVWVQDDVPLDPSWADAVPATAIGRLLGEPSHDRAVLNGWARERTLGIIEELDAEIGPETLVMLASAIAIRTGWIEPFEDIIVVPKSGPWEGRSLSGLSGEFRDLNRVAVADTDIGKLTMFDSLGVDDVDVSLVLGEENAQPGEVLAEAIFAVASERPRRIGSELFDEERAPGLSVIELPADDPSPYVSVLTVRFDVMGSHDLLERPEVFGLRAVSDPVVWHLQGIAPVQLFIQNARQAARAIFTATGFEAAAVTSSWIAGGVALHREVARVISITFDRPFGFLAVERRSRLVLMAGWVNEPEQLEWPASPT